MKLLFAHDTKMIYKDGVYYTSGSFPNQIWERYLNIFDTMVVASRHKRFTGEKLTISSKKGVRFAGIPDISNPKYYIQNVKKASDILTQEICEADAVIARLPSQIGLLAIKLAKKHNRPYLIELVGCPFDSYWLHSNLLGKFIAPINRYKSKLAVYHSDLVLYVTEDYLQSKYPTKGLSVNCSNVEILPPAINILENRITKIKERNSLKIGLIGHIDSKYKGIDTAIKALTYLKMNFPNVELQIVGKGDTNKYKKLINKFNLEKNVSFLGSLPHAEVFTWLEDLDIYIQPSLTEGLPRALIEAMSLGLPAIASNVGGIPELLPERFLTKPNNESDLAKKIIRLIENEKSMLNVAEQNFGLTKRYYKDNLSKERTKIINKLHEKAQEFREIREKSE